VSQSLFGVVSQSPIFPLSLCRNHSMALCRNRQIYIIHCVAITLWLAIFLFVVSQYHH
jgi:hypothetical protein